MDVVHQEVGAAGEGLQRGLPSRMGQVERDATLVRVQVEEEAARIGMRRVPWKGAAASRQVAAASLDLHDIGAEVGEQLGGIGGTHQVPDLEDAQAVEGTGHVQAPSARRTSSATLAGSSQVARRVMSSVCECSPTGHS